MDQATGAHFNLPAHSVANMKMTIIKQVMNQSDAYRKEREEYFIRTFDKFNRSTKEEEKVARL